MLYHELSLEITWLVQYPPMSYPIALIRLIDQFGREAVAAELTRRVAGAGTNVISIANARHWHRPARPTTRSRGD